MFSGLLSKSILLSSAAQVSGNTITVKTSEDFTWDTYKLIANNKITKMIVNIDGSTDNGLQFKGYELVTELEFNCADKNRVLSFTNLAWLRRLKKITFNTGPIEIHDVGFVQCGLESFDISKFKTVPNNTFEGCANLKSLQGQFSSEITAIPYGFLTDCISIENFTISDHITEIGENAFRNCITLKELKFSPNTKLAKLGPYCFANTSIQSFVIQYSVVGNLIGTFMFSQILDVTFEDRHESSGFEDDSLLVLEYRTFMGCFNLKTIRIPPYVNVTIQVLPGQQTGQLFRGCYSLETAILPYTMTRLPSRMFEKCYNLKLVTIENGVIRHYRETVGPQSKRVPQELEDYDPDNVRFIRVFGEPNYIGESCFEDCFNLVQVKFDGITRLNIYIGPYAFSRCRSLKSFKFPQVTFTGELQHEKLYCRICIPRLYFAVW